MAKLSDLLKTKELKKETIMVGDVELPIAFTMQTMAFIQEAYGASYTTFERDMTKMQNRKTFMMDPMTIKIVNSLVYAVVRSGGTETTPEELINAIPFKQTAAAYEQAMKVFQDSYFDANDNKKIAPKN